MSDPGIASAVIIALPATLAASAAWVQARNGARHAKQANLAVNCRADDQPTLGEDVTSLVLGMGGLRRQVGSVDRKIDRHLADHRASVRRSR